MAPRGLGRSDHRVRPQRAARAGAAGGSSWRPCAGSGAPSPCSSSRCSCSSPAASTLYLVLMPATVLFPGRAKAWRAAFIKGTARLAAGRPPRRRRALHHVATSRPRGRPWSWATISRWSIPRCSSRCRSRGSPPSSPASATARCPSVAESMRWARCPLVIPGATPGARWPRSPTRPRASNTACSSFRRAIAPSTARCVLARGGLAAILATRRLPVYLAVSDGLSINRRLVDFVFNVHKMRGRDRDPRSLRPARGPGRDPAFIDGLRDTMVGHLARMRQRNERAA